MNANFSRKAFVWVLIAIRKIACSFCIMFMHWQSYYQKLLK